MVSHLTSIWEYLIWWQRLSVFVFFSSFIFLAIQIAKFIPIIDSYESLVMGIVWLVIHCIGLVFVTRSNIRLDQRKLEKHYEALGR